MTQSQIDQIKWMPKFAVLNKTNKSMLLYDYEPTNEYIKENFAAIATNMAPAQNPLANSASSSSSTSSFDVRQNQPNEPPESAATTTTHKGNDLVYRLDASIRKELFISYWRNRISKFELILTDPNEEKLFNYHRKNSMVGFSDEITARDSGEHRKSILFIEKSYKKNKLTQT
jgi:hypothetical protein